MSGEVFNNQTNRNVRLSIRNQDTTEFWNGTGWQPDSTSVVADRASGDDTTTWSYEFPAPVAGSSEMRLAAWTFDNGSTTPSERINFASEPADIVVDTVDPVPSIESPSTGDAVVAESITVSGQATDAQGIDRVRVAVRRLGEDSWWNGSDWQDTFVHNEATIDSTSATSAQWSYAFPPPASATPIRATAFAWDSANNISEQTDLVTFTGAASGSAVGISSPEWGATLDGAPISIDGNATFDIRGRSVRVSIRGTNQAGQLTFWNGSSWQAQSTSVAATVADAAATVSPWTYELETVGSDIEEILISAWTSDANGPTASASSKVSVGSTDSVAPSVELLEPEWGTLVTSDSITVSGTVANDQANRAVRLSIRNQDSDEFWNGTGWQEAATSVVAQRADNSDNTTWSYVLPSPTAGSTEIRVAVWTYDEGSPTTSSRVNFEADPAADPSATKVIILAGQSNMMGFGLWDSRPSPGHPVEWSSRLLFSSRDLNQQFGDGVAPFTEWNRYGPERSMAMNLHEADGETIAIVKHAIGSTKIESWQPAGNSPDENHYDGFISHIEDSIDELTSQGRQVEVEAVVWLQGESDSDETVTSYGNYLTDLMTGLEADLDAKLPDPDDLSIVLVQPAIWGPTDGDVAQAMTNYASQRPAVTYIETSDILGRHNGQEVHFDAAGTVEIGNRIAGAIAN